MSWKNMVVQKLQRKVNLNKLLINGVSLFIILFGLITITYSQETGNVSMKPSDYKYRIGQNVPINQENKLFLTISIERREYKYEELIATIKTLKCKYSNFEKIEIVILDNYNSAKRLTAMQQNNPNYEKDQSAVRGFYLLDQVEKIEYIKFSSRKGQIKKRYELNDSLTNCKTE